MCPFYEGYEKKNTADIKNWNVLCSDTSSTCFEKAHNYYIPNNLFKKGKTIHGYNLSKIDGKSKLYIKRKKVLTGIRNGYQIPKTNNKKKSLKRNDINENETFSSDKSDGSDESDDSNEIKSTKSILI